MGLKPITFVCGLNFLNLVEILQVEKLLLSYFKKVSTQTFFNVVANLHFNLGSFYEVIPWKI